MSLTLPLPPPNTPVVDPLDHESLHRLYRNLLLSINARLGGACGGTALSSVIFVTSNGNATTSNGVIAFSNGTGLNISGANSTISYSVNSTIPVTFSTNSGNAIANGNIIKIIGDGTTATTIGANNTVVITSIGGSGSTKFSNIDMATYTYFGGL